CPAQRTKPLGTQGSARSDVESGMGRGAVSPLGSGAQTIPVKDLVVGRATAESPGAGCGAGRDRCTDESQVPSNVMTAGGQVPLGARRGRSGNRLLRSTVTRIRIAEELAQAFAANPRYYFIMIMFSYY